MLRFLISSKVFKRFNKLPNNKLEEKFSLEYFIQINSFYIQLVFFNFTTTMNLNYYGVININHKDVDWTWYLSIIIMFKQLKPMFKVTQHKILDKKSLE